MSSEITCVTHPLIFVLKIKCRLKDEVSTFGELIPLIDEETENVLTCLPIVYIIYLHSCQQKQDSSPGAVKPDLFFIVQCQISPVDGPPKYLLVP